MRAFTLIETVIYIALFSFIMSSVLLSVYGMTQSGTQFATKNMTANEGEFVISKNYLGSFQSRKYYHTL